MALRVFLAVILMVAIAEAIPTDGNQATNSNLNGGEPVSTKPSDGQKPAGQSTSDSDSSDSKDTDSKHEHGRNTYYYSDSDSDEYSDSYEGYRH